MNNELLEIQHWSSKNCNVILYLNTGYIPDGIEKKFKVIDLMDSKINCDFNYVEFAVRYAEAIVKKYEEDK